MKYALGILCLSALSIVLLSGSAAPSMQATKPANGAQAAIDALTERVTTLEKQLSTASTQCSVLSKDLDETRALLDKTLAYLGQQALAARDLGVTLDTAEQQGFAVGENHGSRKTLLEGWRKQIATAQADLPQATKAVAPTARVTPQPRTPVKPAPQK